MAYKFYVFWWPCRDAKSCVSTEIASPRMVGAIIRLCGIVWAKYAASVRLGNVETQNFASLRRSPRLAWWALLFACAVSHGAIILHSYG